MPFTLPKNIRPVESLKAELKLNWSFNNPFALVYTTDFSVFGLKATSPLDVLIQSCLLLSSCRLKIKLVGSPVCVVYRTKLLSFLLNLHKPPSVANQRSLLLSWNKLFTRSLASEFLLWALYRRLPDCF